MGIFMDGSQVNSERDYSVGLDRNTNGVPVQQRRGLSNGIYPYCRS
jgi:hypothetical protein